MTSIIVADKDESVSRKFQEELEAIRPEWDIFSCTRGEEVLARLAQNQTDCVLTNITLQDMSGLELLQTLQAGFSDVVRITLTEELEQEPVLESAFTHHRFVDQSTPIFMQAETIESSIRLHAVLRTDELRNRIGNVTNLPSIPEIYQQMVRELSCPMSTLHSVSRIIETDTALMASVLKIVNSALYARTQKIESLTQAVALLGIHFIKNVTLTTELFNKFTGSEIDLVKLRALNDKANRTGALSNHFARLARLPRQTMNHVQLAGMLGNVGDLLVLGQQTDSSSSDHDLYSNTEMQGAYLLRLWLLPDPVVEAVAFQFEPIRMKFPTLTPLHVLHAIRYLETNYTEPDNNQQRVECHEYLQHFAGEELSVKWTDAYSDLLLLTEHTSASNSRAA